MLMFTEELSKVGRECPDPLYTVTRLASNDLETGTAPVAQGVCMGVLHVQKQL